MQIIHPVPDVISEPVTEPLDPALSCQKEKVLRFCLKNKN
jgi:hypothetical protein